MKIKKAVLAEDSTIFPMTFPMETSPAKSKSGKGPLKHKDATRPVGPHASKMTPELKTETYVSAWMASDDVVKWAGSIDTRDDSTWPR